MKQPTRPPAANQGTGEKHESRLEADLASVDRAPASEPSQYGYRVRRSQRLIAQSTVLVEGKFSDGRPYLDSAPVLILSAHGCLVTLTKPVTMGESFVMRNSNRLQERHCQVVYIGKEYGGRTEVGLGFEVAAPDFWGVDHLPSERKAVAKHRGRNEVTPYADY